ncbi:ABC1 kinase family protein [Sphingobacterium faecale]|uniref:AarF/ABC1/UbiB kinase family protein n=1 Tax=Sphingobacterium faecale TaxID=2803775 RepID=A0ABS1R320_9SPHI|nr:AarF/UbiB family protein [Sphingobacterium faecale]MBL1409097.1 AarF/ABC1/UbiB kinase family protein [Sphingobacterium faecale]
MENPIARQKNKLMRAAKLISILGKHGFEDLRSKITNKESATASSEDTTGDQAPLFYERIRKVIEELGPTYVKFGQTLSTREDLLPPGLILELKKLQDNVSPEDIDIRSWLENELQVDDLSEIFEQIDEQPFASASIAQVYKASLSNGAPVILKVKRTGIRKIVTSDLLLLKDIISLLIDYYPLVREINLPDIFEAFEKNIMEELSFQHELKNIQQFARNFRDEPRIQCMQAYPELSTDSLLCISRIEGFRITDSASIKLHQLDPEYIIDTGLDLYLTQVLEHGFFHADPHPGNILVTPSGHLAFIDLGAMARLLPKDKEHLENFILYFINKDVDNLIRTIKRMSLRIHIKNEKILERDIQAMFDMIAAQSLQELDVKAVFSKFSKILNQNDILMPDHIYLLVRGIVLLEGIGRSLLPDLNIIDKVKPYITKIMARRLSPPYIIENVLHLLQQLQGTLSAAPKSLIDLLHKVEQGELKFRIDSEALGALQQQQRKDSSINRYLYIAGILFLGGCLLSGVPQSTLLGIPWISWILFAFSLLFFALAGIRKMRIG